jgi:UDP:flavonoid glycosyltransferase YjiC (YdhE family)
MSERILFFPWGLGGAAYTGRCLLTAEELRQAGHQVAIAGSGIESMVRSARLRLIPQPASRARNTGSQHISWYLPFANVERVFAVGGRYYRNDTLNAQFEEDLRVAQEFDPTIIVIDMSPTASLVARFLRIPLVSIADVDYLLSADNAWMPWLTVRPEKVLPYPSCLPILDRKSRELGLGGVAHVTDLLWGDLTLIASVRELERLPNDIADHREVHYVGPMYWDPPTAQAAFDPLPDNGRKRVYVTIGSGNMVPSSALQAIFDACAGQDWNVFTSIGLANRTSLRVPCNVRLGGFTGLDRPLRWADMIISHGGANTVLACLTQGKPSLVIPFMSEMEMNGRQLVENRAVGILLRKTVVDPSTGKVGFVGRRGVTYSDPALRVDEIRACVAEVLDSETMRVNAAHISQSLRVARDGRDLATLICSVVRR